MSTAEIVIIEAQRLAEELRTEHQGKAAGLIGDLAVALDPGCTNALS